MGAGVLKEKIRKFPIRPSFFLLLFWFIFTKNIYSFLLFCAVVFSHELGHFFVARKLGYRLNSFYIAPYGICLNYKESFFDAKDEIFIAFAGPAVNFISCVLCIALWWIYPTSFAYTQEFVFQSLMLGLFNLLPCYPLDGGRILVGLLSKWQPRNKAIKCTMVSNVVFASFLFVMFFISIFIDFNPSLCFCAVFLILGLLDTQKECCYRPNVLYKKKTKNFSKPFFYVVNGDTELGHVLKKVEVNKFTIFIVLLGDGKIKMIDEEKIKLMTLMYPLKTKLSEILN